jgi:putative membrane protein
MNKTNLLPVRLKILVGFVILVHLMFFILEAIFWMQPTVNLILLGFLNNPVSVSYPIQALTLRNLFINQGFYNLFIALGGIAGLILVGREKLQVGYALILFLCFCGFGAGLILCLSTLAYLLAALQALPAALTFLLIYPRYKRIA